ncbi:hypothetical protein LJG08_27120 [Pseudomonas aeruginosa]|uniref:hypothetical protein n=1 Tax=Pseudomonas aeruginosa TaxID=287 RepID=UPI0004512DBC|nr:hypothetical protein [Pseudomonas aeruginosa]ETV62915.1 hypothetical protein Q042_00534 [Pseudomonas aeruginosa BWHPSA037]MCC0516709.1 hypothetical protein [Pseudomonas aeruginosa]
MSSTQHQLIEQCATRLRGIVEALDNIHDNTPHRWSTDLDDVHSSAESLLAMIKDQAPTQAAQGLAGAALAQPSPAQAEQAEAERPEVVAYFDRNYPSTGDAFIWSNYKGSPYEPVMTVAQHDRIAGALRAENAQLSEDLNRLSIIRSRLNLRLDFALDKISKLESRWPHGESPEERFEHYISNTIDRAPEPLRRLGNWLSHVLDEDQWTTAERMLTGACVAAEERAAAQTQHSVPEGWKPVPIEPLLNMMSDKDHDTRIMAERQLLSILAAAPDKEVGHE